VEHARRRRGKPLELSGVTGDGSLLVEVAHGRTLGSGDGGSWREGWFERQGVLGDALPSSCFVSGYVGCLWGGAKDGVFGYVRGRMS
jgi:hypothetical protein